MPFWTARQADVAGIGIVAALAAWFALGAGDGEVTSLPGPALALLAAIVGAAVVGRTLTDRSIPVAGPIAFAVLATFVLTYPGLLSAAGAPTGYANANATLAAVGTLAAVAAARLADPGRARQAWVVAAGALAGVTAATGSVAGTVALAVAAALVAAGRRPDRAPAVPIAGFLLVFMTIAVTAAVAVGGADGVRAGDEVRADLWSAAADLAREEPLWGLGIGAFEAQNPVSDDADLRWAHHEYLEVALEAGAPGLVLVLALAAWVAARLWTAIPQHPVLATAAVGAATMVGLHGAVDHVWHRPAPIVLAAALIGAATAAGRPATLLHPADEGGHWV
jgi:O-antigen ligase